MRQFQEFYRLVSRALREFQRDIPKLLRFRNGVYTSLLLSHFSEKLDYLKEFRIDFILGKALLV